jgi:hypothetical protein
MGNYHKHVKRGERVGRRKKASSPTLRKFPQKVFRGASEQAPASAGESRSISGMTSLQAASLCVEITFDAVSPRRA